MAKFWNRLKNPYGTPVLLIFYPIFPQKMAKIQIYVNGYNWIRTSLAQNPTRLPPSSPQA